VRISIFLYLCDCQLFNFTLDHKNLRPVIVKRRGETQKGYFHRFVYQSHEYYSTTRVLIELDDGSLKYFDPEFVRFTDRKKRSE